MESVGECWKVYPIQPQLPLVPMPHWKVMCRTTTGRVFLSIILSCGVLAVAYKRPPVVPIVRPSRVGKVYTVAKQEFLPTPATTDGGSLISHRVKWADFFNEEREGGLTASEQLLLHDQLVQLRTITALAQDSRLEVIGASPALTPWEGEWVKVKNLTHPAMGQAWIRVDHLLPVPGR